MRTMVRSTTYGMFLSSSEKGNRTSLQPRVSLDGGASNIRRMFHVVCQLANTGKQDWDPIIHPSGQPKPTTLAQPLASKGVDNRSFCFFQNGMQNETSTSEDNLHNL